MVGHAAPIGEKLHDGPFHLGDFRVDPQRNRVVVGEAETALQPKVMDVLCALAERHGEVVSREALIDLVWGKEYGADESLTRAISLLRKVFGDTRDEPRIIETIAKRGYRLMVAPIAAVSVAPRRRMPARRIAIAALAASVLVAVVLLALRPWTADTPLVRSERTGIVVTVEPFASDADRIPAARGLAGALSAALARSPLIRVRAGGTPAPPAPGTLQYRLRSEIRHVGARFKVSAQLLDAASGELVWGESYDWPYDPQFSAREASVAAISSELLLPLLRSAKAKLADKPALALVPWELTLLVTWVPGDEFVPSGPPHENSYWLQRRALELDPDYAPAHALFGELAAYHALFHPPSDTPEARARARSHIERAVELAPYDAEVLYQVALYYRFSGEREPAEAMLRRVLDLQPNHPLARIDLDFVRGQCAAVSDAEIASLSERISRLSPSSPMRWVALSHLSSIHLARGDFERARAAALASRRIIPMTWTAMTLAAADAALGRKAEAAAILAQHRREWPDLDLHYFAERIAPRWCFGGPRAPQAQAIFRRLADTIAPAQK